MENGQNNAHENSQPKKLLMIPRAPRSSDPSNNAEVVAAAPADVTARRSHKFHVSARTAPSNGNMFTRFMKTSIGADVGPPLPRLDDQQTHLIHPDEVETLLKSSSARLPERKQFGSTAAGLTGSTLQLTNGGSLTSTGIELNPLHRPKPDARRQIGVLCNNMTNLDMIALAHRVVPAVSLGSPRFESQPPPKLGEERYDYQKHQRASTKVVERADVALGQRANVSVVFYKTNPGALTSRRDFKLITVPNHRDIEESLRQQHVAKRAPRCAHHATADFSPSSSDDEEGGDGGARLGKRKAKHGATTSARGGSKLGASSVVTPQEPAVVDAPLNGAASRSTSLVRGATGDAHHHVGAVGGTCVCTHCVYVRDELDRFDRSLNPSAAAFGKQGGGSGSTRKQTIGSSKKQLSSRPRAVTNERHEQHRRFLVGPAFAAGTAVAAPPGTAGSAGGGAGNSRGPAPPLLQRLLSYQAALEWIRGLDSPVHAAVRCAIVQRFPTLLQEFDTAAGRQRRITISEFLCTVAVSFPYGNPIAPQRRDVVVFADPETGAALYEPVGERFTLPARPLYAAHHFNRSGHQQPQPQQQQQPPSGLSSAEATSLPIGAPQPSMYTQAELLSVNRPWEELFAIFDPNTTGSCDRFQILLTILAATSHHVLLHPETLKFDSRQFSHVSCIVLLLSVALCHERSPTDGPVRLGELFAIRDFLKGEIRSAKALATVDMEGWVFDSERGQLRKSSLQAAEDDKQIDNTSASNFTKKKRKQLLSQFNTVLSRVDEFALSGTSMIEQEDLLDAAQVASLLQETLLL